MHHRIATLIFMLGLAVPGTGTAWDGATLLPPGTIGTPIKIERAFLSADGSGWVQGPYGQLFRLRDGKIRRVDVPSPFGTHAGVYVAAPMPDGGIVGTISGDGCSTARFTSDGRIRWTAAYCNEAVANADGTVWLGDYLADPNYSVELRHLGTDGSLIALPDPAVQADVPGHFGRRRLFPAPGGDGVFVIGGVGTGNGAQARILRLDAAGKLLWRWQSSDVWRGNASAAVTPDGEVVLAGIAPTAGGGAANSNILQVARVSADGRLRWINRAVRNLAPEALSLLGHRDGGASLHAYSGTDYEYRLVRLRADGSVAWEKDSGIEDASEYQPLPLLTEADDGSTQLVGGNLVGPDLGLRYLRVGSDGEIRINRTIGNHVPALAGGTIYLAGPTHAPLARLTDGGDLAPTAYTGATATTQMVLAASTSGAAGAEFLLTSDRDEDDRRPQPHYAVTRVSADGRIAWQRDVADQIGDDEDAGSAAITANATRVCTLTRRMRPGVDDIYWRRIGYIECLDAATGSPLWQREVARSVGYGSVGAVLLPDGKLLAAWSAYEGHHVELFDTDGRSLQVAFGDHNISGIASHRSGQLALLLWDESADGTLIRVFGPDAKQRYAVTRGALGIRGPVSSVAIDENGAIAAFGLAPVDAEPTTVNGVVYHTDPTTNRSWRTVLPPLQNDGLWANLLLSENALYVAQRYNPNIQGSSMPSSRPRPTHLYRLDRSSGSLRWHAESTHGDLNAQVMALSADGSRLVSLHGHRQRLRVETYGSVDGRLLSDGWQDCAALECEPSRLSVGGDGTFRLIAQAQSSDYGTGAAVYRERDLDGSAPPVRLGQPGIAGAWWSPYANGEGITFDWLPASRTLFGAWFTYSTGGSNAASELRWYTVQANGVADGAGKVELPILQTGGGVFDAGPTVSPQRVGTAQLEFHDCNKAILHYAFDATVNDGRQGTITLSRLSPATQPCLLSDGSSVPGAGARPPQNGFDARLSGSWFDEATAGQGLEFTVQPGGVFFAPWFTFDPAGSADDTNRQHWFTLQGDLAQARDGKAELVLVQTLGGAFDSQPTYNANAIGSASLRVLGCDRAELDYRVDDTINAGAFRGRSGTLRLTRAGGCAP
ncbi:hypothetical protein ACFJIW_06845 [Tahibacter sp. UC22_41]|uniref:hypothetical protein n=1 Tax=Tahibacter sp. UC22_41 TaxID=3350178 RepID=UPI0036DD461E